MDEFVDALLVKERVCDVALPRMPKRAQLEEEEKLGERVSALGSEIGSDVEEVSDAEVEGRSEGEAQ